tara:strand:- start:806 stop:1015 length:210 start_codon:yes stop_codon:yes gene_type:complete
MATHCKVELEIRTKDDIDPSVMKDLVKELVEMGQENSDEWSDENTDCALISDFVVQVISAENLAEKENY